MHMTWLPSAVFWGLLLILIGGLLILRTAFNLHVPILRTVIGVVLIYFGISFLVGAPYTHLREDNRVAFEQRTVVATPAIDDYTIIFSQGTVDLTQLETGRYEVSTIFSSGTIVLDKETPAEVRVSAAFASTDLPQGRKVVLGETTFTTGPEDAADRLVIDANVVFGSLRVILR